MTKHRQSREQWQQELWERQHNVTPEEVFRAVHYVAKETCDSLPAPSVLHRTKLLLGMALMGLGAALLPALGPRHRVFGALAVIAGTFLFIAAFRWRSIKSKHPRQSRHGN